MGKKLKITESQLKMLVENKNKIQEQNESDIDELKLGLRVQNPSKEDYLARHGEDPMGWTGSSNDIYPSDDLGDDFGDEETYDDFDTLHNAHPDFHKHYSASMGPEHARKMFDTYKEKHGPLRIKRKRHIDNELNESIEKIKANFKRFL